MKERFANGVVRFMFEPLRRFFTWALGPDTAREIERICAENVGLRDRGERAEKERDEARKQNARMKPVFDAVMAATAVVTTEVASGDPLAKVLAHDLFEAVISAVDTARAAGEDKT